MGRDIQKLMDKLSRAISEQMSEKGATQAKVVIEVTITTPAWESKQSTLPPAPSDN